VTMACASGQVVLSFVLRAVLIRRNRERDALYGPVPEDVVMEVMEDRTDFENKNFRYSY
jgi:hypothetical protein